MKPDWAEYAKGVEAQLEQLRKDLEPLESGKMKLGEKVSGQDWRDITAETIAHNKTVIGTYETILADIKANKL